MDVELVHEALKNFKFTTTPDMLMKLSTVMCFHEIFNLTKKMGLNS